MSGNRLATKDNGVPGPAAYDQKNIIKAKNLPRCVIGRGPQRHVDMTTRREVPGPGNYDIKGANSTGVKFGRDYRGRDLSKDGPGPGAYKIPVKVADVPKYLNTNQPEEFRFV